MAHVPTSNFLVMAILLAAIRATPQLVKSSAVLPGSASEPAPEQIQELGVRIDLMVQTLEQKQFRIRGLHVDQPVLCEFLASIGTSAVEQISQELCTVGTVTETSFDTNSTQVKEDQLGASSDLPSQEQSSGGGDAASIGIGPAHLDMRRLQGSLANCSGNSNAGLDVLCAAAGMVPVANTASTLGSNQSGCCTCPDGTSAAYGDEALAFRFRSEGITTSAEDGSLRWDAAVPSGLAFTMSRPPDPGATQSWYTGLNFSEPSRVVPPGVAAGVHFEPSATDQIMYSNRRLAVGAESTFFAVVTPAADLLFMAPVISFRPGDGLGCLTWTLGNTGSCLEAGPGEANENATGCMQMDDWAITGFVGPPYHKGTTQILIFRTRKQHNSIGVVGPVADMALVSDIASGPASLSWTSSLVGEGLNNFNREGVSAEEFDIDVRDPAIDAGSGGMHTLGAGYMLLGHWALAYNSFFQFHGVIHAVELHDVALSDGAVDDIVANIRSWLDPTVPAPPKCEPCLEGTFDRDGDPASICEPCDSGRFSGDSGASIACASTCQVGSTILTVGATSASACTPCPAGSFGAPSSATSDGYTTMVCSACEPGRFSTVVGAESSDACALCSVGRFSGAGWQTCERSGCMDRWADNHEPDATVDDGSCSYSCQFLWNRTRGGTTAGGCVIFEDGGWRQMAPNGTRIGSGVLAVLPEGHWVVQGRAVAGGTATAPEYELYDSGARLINQNNRDVHLRCLSITVEGENIWLKSRARSTMEHVIILDNVATQTPVALGTALHHSFSYLTCVSNRGGMGGGCMNAYNGAVEVSHSDFENNSAASSGGAINADNLDPRNPTSLMVQYSRFINNRALFGGAIFLGSGTNATIRSCHLKENVALDRGGAVAVELATITIMLSMFVANQASSLGAALHIDQPFSAKILDAVFDPFVSGALVVFIGGRLAGCNQHPCDVGHSCSYAQYSLHCSPCPLQQFSTDGLQCASCPAGQGPMHNQSGCPMR